MKKTTTLEEMIELDEGAIESEEQAQGIKITKGLHTQLSPRLWHDITNYCKSIKDPYEKWSYEVGFKDLLEKSRIFENVTIILAKLDELEKRIGILEGKPKDELEVKTLGGSLKTKKEDEKNEQIK